MIHRIRLLLLLSAVFIALAAQNAFAAQGEIIVAKSGGQFTSIQAAIDSVTPSASNPYVIKVMPGQYYEQVTLKSYIHLQGSGPDTTEIRCGSNATILIQNLTGVSVTDFSIWSGWWGIKVVSSSPTIARNKIFAAQEYAIYNIGASPTIVDNLITSNDAAMLNDNSAAIIKDNMIINNVENWDGRGILEFNNSSSIITGNLIQGNRSFGIQISDTSASTISNNIITNNGGNGVLISAGASGTTPLITNNTITGNGSSYTTDIAVYGSATPNFSFNIYNTITGTSGVGLYNVKSDGTPAPAP